MADCSPNKHKFDLHLVTNLVSNPRVLESFSVNFLAPCAKGNSSLGASAKLNLFHYNRNANKLVFRRYLIDSIYGCPSTEYLILYLLKWRAFQNVGQVTLRGVERTEIALCSKINYFIHLILLQFLPSIHYISSSFAQVHNLQYIYYELQSYT